MSRSLTPYAELADVLTLLPAAVREARRARGLTQETAAAQAGVPQATLSELERGTGNCTTRTAVAVLRWLGQPAHQPTIGGRP